MVNLELHNIRREKKFGNRSRSNPKDNPFRSFRNSRDDRRGESTTVTCADCGTECRVPFIPKTDRPVYCSDCFAQNKSQDSGNDRYSRNDRGSRYSKYQDSRPRRGDYSSKSTKLKSLKKQETFYSGGSDKFYNTLKEKLFEILGGKVCMNCGFKDERALGISHNIDEDSFDSVRRGGFASSWGKYISDPDLARKELKILCLNCNELKKPTLRKETTKDFKKKKNRFPR